jgi:dynein intermediate chain
MGTEEGTVFQGIRHGSNSGVGDAFEGHFGPITSIDFHPPASIGSSFNFSHLFLTSAMDWSCNLWSRKVSKSLSTFHDFGDYVYDAKWFVYFLTILVSLC